MKNVSKTTIQKCIDLLSLEYNFYKELQEVLIQERNALVKIGNEELSNINFSKESILINIIEVKNKRKDIMQNISELLNVDVNQINLTFLANNFEEFSSTFIKIRDDFKKIGVKIKSLNETNKHIINSSLQFIQSSLNIIFQGSNRAVYTNYGKVSVNNNYIKNNQLYSSKI